MFSYAFYVAAGVAASLALDYVSAPTNESLLTSSAVSASVVSLHTVDRTKKGDRLTPTLSRGKFIVPVREQKMLEGCDPAFSNLSSYSKMNFAGRCLV